MIWPGLLDLARLYYRWLALFELPILTRLDPLTIGICPVYWGLGWTLPCSPFATTVAGSVPTDSLRFVGRHCGQRHRPMDSTVLIAEFRSRSATLAMSL